MSSDEEIKELKKTIAIAVIINAMFMRRMATADFSQPKPEEDALLTDFLSRCEKIFPEGMTH